MSKIFSWAVIGSGNIASTCTSQLKTSKNHRVVAIYSRNIQTAEKLAKSLNATPFDNFEKAVTLKEVDAVYIATPHSSHCEYAKKCIELGKPVLIEKSMCVNEKQCKEVFDLAHEKNVYVAEAMWTRFNPVTKQVLEWINQGEIGEIQSVKANFTSPMTRKTAPPRVFEKQYAGGALLDVGVYCVAYCQMILGYPTAILNKGKMTKTMVDANDKIILSYPNDAQANIYCSINNLRGESAVIKGTKGKITVPFFFRASTATLKNHKGRKRFSSHCSYIPQFDKVANDIMAGLTQSAEIPHKDTLEIARIMDECRRQINLYYDCD